MTEHNPRLGKSKTPIMDHIKAIRTILYERHRELVLDEVEQRIKAEFEAAGVGASTPLRRVERVIEEMRNDT